MKERREAERETVYIREKGIGTESTGGKKKFRGEEREFVSKH